MSDGASGQQEPLPDPIDPTAQTHRHTIKRLVKQEQRARWTYVGTACVVLFVVWLSVILATASERRSRLHAASEGARLLTAALKARTELMLEHADTVLRTARRVYSADFEIAGLTAFLTESAPNPGIILDITIVDSKGLPIFGMSDPAPATDAPYFLAAQQATSDVALLSLPVATARHAQNLRLVRRIEDWQGNFAGAIHVAFNAQQIVDSVIRLESGPHSVVGLVGLDHNVRAWSPDTPLRANRRLADSSLWPQLEIASTGIFTEETNSVEAPHQQSLSYAFSTLDSYPLVAIAGYSRQDALNATRRYVQASFAIALLTSLLIVVLTGSVLRDRRLLAALNTEVSVRRRAEKDAIHASEIKTTFLATMSHEVRTPINAIMGLFELIENAEVPERQKRQARAGQVAAGKLFKHLSDVLDASRLEAKSLTLTLRPEPVAPLLDDLLQLLEAAIISSGKALDASGEIRGPLPKTIRMDRRRVEQIALNLIDNAVKFTESGAIALIFDTGKLNNRPCLRISVKDTGPGIARESQSLIFDRFAQVDGAITRKADGSGLGLSICKDLAALMQGDLLIESSANGGATFILLLPMD